jgi:hypothetical protein
MTTKTEKMPNRVSSGMDRNSERVATTPDTGIGMINQIPSKEHRTTTLPADAVAAAMLVLLDEVVFRWGKRIIHRRRLKNQGGIKWT